MEHATDNRDLWEEIVPQLSRSRRIEELPADRFSMPRDSVLALRTLASEMTGEDDPQMLINLVFNSRYRTARYVAARVNSLNAYRHLAPNLYFDTPLIELNHALDGLVPLCDRDHAYDYSEPERYKEHLPLMKAMMGIMKFHSFRLERQFTVQGMSLCDELAVLVRKYPDKASVIPDLLYKRNYERHELSQIEELLATESAPLLEGTL